MQKQVVTLPLDKAATAKGGDRYKGTLCGADFIVYIPQQMSRASGAPAATVTITVEA